MNQFGIFSFSFANVVGQIRGGTLGRAYRPKALAARLALSAKLRKLRHALNLNHLIQIFSPPRMENLIDQTISATKAARTTPEPSDPLQTDASNGRKRIGYGPVAV